jgi:hypothetical protein
MSPFTGPRRTTLILTKPRGRAVQPHDSFANLSDAHLTWAILNSANLSEANLGFSVYGRRRT